MATEAAPAGPPIVPEDVKHTEAFLQTMAPPGCDSTASHIMMSRFQLDACLRAMQTQRSLVAQKRRSMGMAPAGPTRAEQVTIRDLLSFQQDALPTPLLRLDPSLAEAATLVFQEILSFMGLEEGRVLSRDEERLLVSRLLAMLGVHPALRDECYVQLQKQTRNNPYRAACAKAWELFRWCTTCFPPSPIVAAPLTQYFEALCSAQGLEGDVRDLVLATWTSLDHAVQVGPRKIVPSAEEVSAMVNRKALIVPVFLTDDSPENIPYDVSTTIGEAQKSVLKKMQLEDDASFGMFTVRVTKNVGATPGEPFLEHILMDRNRYVGDVLGEFAKQARSGTVSSKLLLKKRYFRPSDAGSTHRVYLQLCYVQLREDYTKGNYLVTDEGAVMLAALQILAELGNVPDPETSLEWGIQLRKSIPKVMWRYKTKDQWMDSVIGKYKGLWALDCEATMREFVNILLSLPLGGASFFTLKTLSDTAQFFPNHVIVGINQHGLHFLDNEVRSVIHAAELSDVSEYAGRPDRVFFCMTLRGELHSFEFGTTGGEEICLMLDHFISTALQAMQVV